MRRGRVSRFVLTPAAEADVSEISDFIAQESPTAARRVREQLRTAMRRLAAMPGLGHLREDLTDEPFRFWSVGAYVIVYRPDTVPLEILRVLHSARDLRALLGE